MYIFRLCSAYNVSHSRKLFQVIHLHRRSQRNLASSDNHIIRRLQIQFVERSLMGHLVATILFQFFIKVT